MRLTDNNGIRHTSVVILRNNKMFGGTLETPTPRAPQLVYVARPQRKDGPDEGTELDFSIASQTERNAEGEEMPHLSRTMCKDSESAATSEAPNIC